MKKTYLFLILSCLFTIRTSLAQENLKQKSTIEKNGDDAKQDTTDNDKELSEEPLDDYQETVDLKQAETQILFELINELKGNFYLDEETFQNDSEFTPEYMIDLYFKTHEVAKQSYSYSKRYKRQCKAFSIKDLEKLQENNHSLTKETWSFDEVNEINIKLNNLSKEKYDKDLKKKIKKQEKSQKKREKRKKREEREKEKKLKKRNTLFSSSRKKKSDKEDDDEKKDNDKIEKNKKNKKPYRKNDFIILTDKTSYKSMAKDDELEKDRIYIKVSEPLFIKNKKRAMIFVSHEDKKILDNYLVVLRKKSKGWCIQGKIEANKQSIEKIKPIKKEFDPYNN